MDLENANPLAAVMVQKPRTSLPRAALSPMRKDAPRQNWSARPNPLLDGSAALEELHLLWADCGLPQAEREERLSQLRERLEAQLTGEVRTQKGERDQLQQEEPKLREELTSLHHVLGSSQPQLPETLLLVPRHRALSKSLDQVRTTHSQRLAQRGALETKLTQTLSELNTLGGTAAAKPEWAEIEPDASTEGGLSLTIIGRLEARCAAASAERAARIDEAALLSSALGRLESELGLRSDDSGRKSDAEEDAGRIAITELQAKLSEREEEKARRLRVATSCAAYIAQLRRKLGLVDDQCATLAPPQNAISAAQLGLYEAEIERLEKLRAEQIPRLLENAKDRLRPLWEALYLSATEASSTRITSV